MGEYFCPQEVFEARYVKIPQEGCRCPHLSSNEERGDGVEMSSTTSESESCSDGASEEVATQLANLKERVGITHLLCVWPFFGGWRGFSCWISD